MTRPLKPATAQQEIYLTMAVNLLRIARDHAERSGSPRAVAAIRRALKSAEGAQRHMRHRRRRTEETPCNDT